MKSQIATTSEQSARLLQCGVPAESADMYIDNYDELWACPFKDSERKDEEGFAPAWSLSALLELLPDIITYGGYQWGLFITKLGRESLCFSYARWDDFNSTIGHISGNAIEACVKAIEWLSELGYKLNEI